MWAITVTLWAVIVAMRNVHLLCGTLKSLPLILTDENTELRPKNGEKTKTEKKNKSPDPPAAKQKTKKKEGNGEYRRIPDPSFVIIYVDSRVYTLSSNNICIRI